MALPGTGLDMDLMSAYLQSCLLEQTKERQAQLDVLQKLTELKLGETFNEPSMVNGFPIEIPRVGTGVPSKLRAEARGQPAKVEIPSNFFPLPQNVKETVDQSQKLQHATQVLQAALANWEACVSGFEAPAVVPALAPSAAKPVVQPQKPILEINSRLGHQAEEATAKPAGVLTSLLEKAIHNLNDTLPPDAAVIAQALLEGVATEAAPSISYEVNEKRKWLQHVLENQNAASIQRLTHLLKEPAVPPLTPGWDASGLLGAASAAALQGATSGIGRSPTLSPYSALDSNSLLSGPGTPVGNWWQDNARHGFAAVAAQAQAQVQAQQAQQQREMLQRQALLYMLQQSQTSPTAAPQQQQRLPHPVGSVSTSKDVAALRKGGGPKRRVTAAPSVEPPEAHHGETLRMHLRSLLAVDSNRVLIVRKINRLGFSSPTILKEHYSWYGTVENVLVAHSRVKSGSGQAGIVSRLRPSGLGFIVMSKMEEADAILKQGSEQHVCGALIRVQKFERRMSEMEEEDDDEEAGDVSIEGSNDKRQKDLCEEEVAERMLKGA